jgi:streptogramin lyase
LFEEGGGMEYSFNLFMRKKILQTIFVINVLLLFTFCNFIRVSEVQAVSLKPGDIIATHYRTAEVFLVDPVSGDLTLISSGGMLIEPSGVVLDSNGNILIADMLKGIIRIDPIDGTQSLICSLDGAFGIAVGKNGYIYTSTYVGTPPNSTAAIVRVDPLNGTTTTVSLDESLLIPREIEIDMNGDIVVADQGIAYLDDGKIIRVNSNTGNQTVISSGGMIRTIRGLAIEESGQILIGENRNPPRIIRVDPTNGSQIVISTEGLLISPVGIAVEENGSILVADNGTGAPGDGAIIRIDAVTGVQTLLTSAATSNGRFTNGRGITVVPTPTPDTTPPELVEFDFDPKTIDVSSGPQTVTVTLRVTDDLSGVRVVRATFARPSGPPNIGAGTILISGDDMDGVYEGTLNFPQFIEAGIWRADFITLSDLADNEIVLRESDLIDMSFSTELQVVYIEDTDGDGIPDDEDACLFSDLNDTIVIDGCDSDVQNVLLDDGCTISDLISQCSEDANNHGEFVSSVSHTTNSLKKNEIISSKDKGMIQKCAANADIP